MIDFNQAQDEMIDHALEHQCVGAYAKPGVGKTRASLEIMAATPGKTLVVAPHLVCTDTWPAENKKWGYDFEMSYLHGKRKDLDNVADVTLINYDGLPWLAGEMKKHGNPFTSVIYDEASKLKHPGTSRFKRWKAHVEQFTYRMSMTGSPLGNRVEDLWGETFIYDAGAKLGTSKEKFLLSYFVQMKPGQWRPIHGAKELIFEIVKPQAKAWDIDCLDMPPIIHNVIGIDMPAKAREWYDELERDGTLEEIDFVADNKLVVMGKQRQIAAGAIYDPDGCAVKLHGQKKARLKELIDEQAGEPMLVVMEFAHDLDAIKEAAKGLRVGVLNGKTTERQQERYLKQWNAGELDILAFHPLSAGYGLNLQSVSSTIVFYTCPWSLELVEQSFRRLWRQGQKNKVVVHYLAVRGSIDEHVLKRIDQKEDDQDAFFAALTDT